MNRSVAASVLLALVLGLSACSLDDVTGSGIVDSGTVQDAEVVGKQATSIRDKLTDAGYFVTLTAVPNDGTHEEGTVERIEPATGIEKGDALTIYWYGAP